MKIGDKVIVSFRSRRFPDRRTFSLVNIGVTIGFVTAIEADRVQVDGYWKERKWVLPWK